MSVNLHQVVELICLVYHEARNVRHPIKAGKLVDSRKYAKLVQLPTNRDQAWRHMRILRDRAGDSGAIEAATEVFQQFFELNLPELGELYGMSIWKSSACGGNNWVHITSRVCDLIDTMNAGGSDAPTVYREIMSMSHNTGQVEGKLRALRAL